MRFALKQMILGRTPEIELSYTEYEQTVRAWNVIASCCMIEEQWDSLIQTYVELELSFLEAATKSVVWRPDDYSEMQQVRMMFSRRLSNLLHVAKTYLGYVPHQISGVFNSETKSSFEEFTNEEYDSCLSYRLMEALRNYSQHRDVPLHGASFNAGWTGEMVTRDDMGSLRYSAQAYIDLGRLRSDEKFKRSILKEFEDTDKVGVFSCSREYVESLSNIHIKLRNLLEAELKNSKATIRSSIEKYEAENRQHSLGLAAVKFSEDNVVIDQTNLFDDLILHLETLENKNRRLHNLKLSFVSNEPIEPKKSGKLRLT